MPRAFARVRSIRAQCGLRERAAAGASGQTGSPENSFSREPAPRCARHRIDRFARRMQCAIVARGMRIAPPVAMVPSLRGPVATCLALAVVVASPVRARVCASPTPPVAPALPAAASPSTPTTHASRSRAASARGRSGGVCRCRGSGRTCASHLAVTSCRSARSTASTAKGSRRRDHSSSIRAGSGCTRRPDRRTNVRGVSCLTLLGGSFCPRRRG